MGIITGAALIVLGILGAASVIAKKPGMDEVVKKLAQYQGWIGFVGCIWGVWTIISAILNLGWLTTVPIWWVTYLATGVIEAGLGFILGYGLIQQFALAKASDEVKAKAQEGYQKLVSVQIPLGYAGIGLGIWCLIGNFMFL